MAETGLRCPYCNSRRIPVEGVRQQFDEAKRYRKCRDCGKRIKSYERIVLPPSTQGKDSR